MSIVVCGTDLSPASWPATQAAASLARLLGVGLELFHVVTIPPFLGPDLLDEEVVTDLRQAGEAILSDQAARLRKDGLQVTTTARVGTLDELWHHVRDCGAAALVIGTHARKGPARFVIGSFAERTMASVACPVLVVPPHAQGRMVTGEPIPQPLSLLIGIDGSPASDAALAWVAALRGQLACDVKLLHLYDPAQEHDRLGFPPPVAFESDPEVVAVLARELNAHVVPQLGEALPIRIRPTWGGEGDPLAWEAEMDGADLLVIGTSQTRRTSARGTVRGARLPVLCVPGRAEARRAAGPSTIGAMLVVVDQNGPVSFVSDACHQLMPKGGRVVLMHVLPPTGTPTDTDEIETALLGLMPGEDGNAYHALTFVTASAPRGEAIVKAVHRFAPDVVVMSSSPATGAGKGFTTIEYVVRNSPKPLVVFPSSRRRSDA